jgi:hypothetical protein
VKSGEFAAIHVDLIARGGAVDAIPILKEQFERVQDPLLKAKIAAALVRMGDKDKTYRDFLVKQATPALESDAPDFKSYDSQGKAVRAPSPEFEAWAKTNGASPESAVEDSLYILPARIAILLWSGDRRAIPLLRQGLLSPNHIIQIMAALGLAEIGDKDSIPFIIDACKKARPIPRAQWRKLWSISMTLAHRTLPTSLFPRTSPKSFATGGLRVEGRSAIHSSRVRRRLHNLSAHA